MKDDDDHRYKSDYRRAFLLELNLPQKFLEKHQGIKSSPNNPIKIAAPPLIQACLRLTMKKRIYACIFSYLLRNALFDEN